MLNDEELSEAIEEYRQDCHSYDNKDIIDLVRENTPAPSPKKLDYDKLVKAIDQEMRYINISAEQQSKNIATLCLGYFTPKWAREEIERLRGECDVKFAAGRLSMEPNIESLKMEIDSLNALNDTKSKVISKLEAARDKLQQELAALKAKNNRLLSRNDEREQELGDLKAELSAFQSECDGCKIGFAKDAKTAQEAPEGFETWWGNMHEDQAPPCKWIVLFPSKEEARHHDSLFDDTVIHPIFSVKIPAAPKPVSEKTTISSMIKKYQDSGFSFPDGFLKEMIDYLEDKK